MTIRVSCHRCAKIIRAPDDEAGKTTRCPACGSVLHLPGPVPTQRDDLESEGAGDRPVFQDDGPVRESSATEPSPARQKSHDARRPNRESTRDPSLELPGRSRRPRRHLYWCLLLAFIPLSFSLLGDRSTDAERIARTLKQHRDVINQLPEPVDDAVFALLPFNRIEGAYLPHGSGMQWVFAPLSVAAYIIVIVLLFEMGRSGYASIFGAALFTATSGILILVLFQFIAAWTQGYELIGGSLLMVLFYIVKFIGFSYRCAMDPDTGFVESAIGFTLGVGLCEEYIKAVPLLWRTHVDPLVDWRGACIVGLSSGVAFGAAEGVIYSIDYYNGVSTGGTYLVRFVSCVALHAIWTAAAGISLVHIFRRSSPSNFLIGLGVSLRALSVPILLHGLYDTLLKKHQNAGALIVALLSFGWLAFLIERSHRADRVRKSRQGNSAYA